MYRFYVKDQGRKRLVEYPVREVQYLAQQLGMDFENEEKYKWFLHQALLCLLPIGWKRESDYKGQIQYHNMKTQITTTNHPLIYKFRKCFARLVEKDIEQNFQENTKESSQSDRKNTNNPQNNEILSYEDQMVAFEKLMAKVGKTENNTGEKFIQIQKESKEFYDLLFGGKDDGPPKMIEDSLEYQLINPEAVLNLAKEYGIAGDYRLLWIARVALVLPLPPLWKQELDSVGNIVYVNTEIASSQIQHPARIFLMELIQRVKFNVGGREVSQFTTFYDNECRKYEVDLVKLIQRKDYIVMKENMPDPEFRRRAAYFKPRLTVDEAITDIMVFEIAKSAGINFQNEIHLLGSVYQHLETLKKETSMKHWEFRFTMEGKRYWYNTKEKRSVQHFPFRDEMKKFIKEMRKEIFMNNKIAVRNIADRHPEFQARGKPFYDKVRADALAAAELFLRKNIDSADPEDQYPLTSITRELNRKVSLSEMMDILYACPFAFSVSLLNHPGDLEGYESVEDAPSSHSDSKEEEEEISDINNFADSDEEKEPEKKAPEWFYRKKLKKKEGVSEEVKVERARKRKLSRKSKDPTPLVERRLERSRTLASQNYKYLRMKHDNKTLYSDNSENYDSIEELSASEEDSYDSHSENDIKVQEGRQNDEEILQEKEEAKEEVTEEIKEKPRIENKSRERKSEAKQREPERVKETPTKQENLVVKKEEIKVEKIAITDEYISTPELQNSSERPSEIEIYENTEEINESDEMIKEILEYKAEETKIDDIIENARSQQRAQTLNPTILESEAKKAEEKVETPANVRKSQRGKTISPTLMEFNTRQSPVLYSSNSGQSTTRKLKSRAESSVDGSLLPSSSMPLTEFPQRDGIRTQTGFYNHKPEPESQNLKEIQEEMLRTVSIEGVKLSSSMSFNDMKGLVRRGKNAENKKAQQDTSQHRTPAQSPTADPKRKSDKNSRLWQKVLKRVNVEASPEGSMLNGEQSLKLQEDLSEILGADSENLSDEDFAPTPESGQKKTPDLSSIMEGFNKDLGALKEMNILGSLPTSKESSKFWFDNEGSKPNSREHNLRNTPSRLALRSESSNKAAKSNSKSSSESAKRSDLSQELSRTSKNASSRQQASIYSKQQTMSSQMESSRSELGLLLPKASMPEISERDSPDHSPIEASGIRTANSQARHTSLFEEYSYKAKEASRPNTLDKFKNIISLTNEQDLVRVRYNRDRWLPNEDESNDEKWGESDVSNRVVTAHGEIHFMPPGEEDEMENSRNKSNLRRMSIEREPQAESKKVMKVENDVRTQKLYFMYYLDLIGHPCSSKHSLAKYECSKYIQPLNILFLAKRLGIKVTQSPFSSPESDLVWIAYLQAAAPMPDGFEKNVPITKICSWPYGAHPGDKYFSLILQYQRKIRAVELIKLTPKERAHDLISNSWIEFKNLKDAKYYYNYLSCETSHMIPSSVKFHFAEKSEAEDRKAKLKELLISQDNLLFKTVTKLIGNTKNNTSHSQNIVNIANLIMQSIARKEPLIKDTLTELPPIEERNRQGAGPIPFKLVTLPEIKTSKLPKFSKLSGKYTPTKFSVTNKAVTTRSHSEKAFNFDFGKFHIQHFSPRIPLAQTLRSQ
ncbi:unnamed protein product [Blepharisma stoltei]|uniref:WW domain-containing protein n=1 Tax=Blepharisma stoltei TaxID=1481888 RepID=A0AAU9K9E0_9CILI|nr:unnamed protein product [Blepharisma stoltei]